MGFKRTTEGRVFFQGGNDSANDGFKESYDDTADSKKGALSPKAERPKASKLQTTNIKHSPRAANPAPNAQNAQMQMQIVTLLRSLNDKLKDTQEERKVMQKQLQTYRELIEDLEDKSYKHDKAFDTLDKKLDKSLSAPDPSATDKARASQAEKLAREAVRELEETRKLLLELEDKTDRGFKDIGVLKKMQNEQAGKLVKSGTGYMQLVKRLQSAEERYDDLHGRLEESNTQQARLMRKIDKVMDDRARFMRKIERIEETVLQTRDALNAKAMVLLTDQAAAARNGEEIEDQTLGQALMAERARLEKYEQKFRQETPKSQDSQSDMDIDTALMAAGHKKSGGIRAGHVMAFLVLAGFAALAGWYASTIENEAQSISGFTFDSAREDNAADFSSTSETTPRSNTLSANRERALDTDAGSAQDDVSLNTTSYQGIPEDAYDKDDIGTLNLDNQTEIEGILNGNPDTLAARLNEIEPGSPQNAETPVYNIEPAAGTEDNNSQAAAEPTQQTAPAETPSDISSEAATSQNIETASVDTGADPQSNASQSNSAQANNTQSPEMLTNTVPPVTSDITQITVPDSGLPEIIKDIEAQAIDGSPEAQHDLAAIYTAGHAGVTQSYEKAAYWFAKAAEQGIANARYNLGVLYHQGLGVKPDLERAIQWYENAAVLGHPEAQYNLGIAYIEGIGAPYNPERAAIFFENAARADITEAAYNLGLIYENGLLGQPKPDQAIMWYKAAADQGSPEAEAALNQLAETLQISREEINRLAEDMRQGSLSKEAGQGRVKPTTLKKTENSLTPDSRMPKSGQTKTASLASTTSAPAETPTTTKKSKNGLNDADFENPNSDGFSDNADSTNDNNQSQNIKISSRENTQILTVQIQEYLMRAGMYPGPADGRASMIMGDAIRSYQSANNLPVTGKPSDNLLTHMLGKSPDATDVGSRD